MVARIFWTVAALLFAIGAFCGIGPVAAGPFNPLGLVFLVIAAVVWRNWRVITGNYSPPAFDGITGRYVGSSASRGVAEVYPDKIARPTPPADRP